MEEDLDMLNVKKDLLLVVVAFIILVLVIPEGGLLRDYATEYCNKDYGIGPKLGLGNMWANINPTYSYNKTHTHPNSLWSGVYYIKVPKNSGKLFLEDPRPGPNLYMPKRMDKLPKELWRVVAYDAVEGRMIFFPSWQPHGVDINMNTEKGEKNWRVSVSFNFIQTLE